MKTFCTVPTFHSYCRNMLSVGLDKLREDGPEFRVLFEEYEGQKDIEPSLFGNRVGVRRARARGMNHNR